MKALKQCVEVCFFLNLIGGHKRYFYLESGGRAFNVCNYTKCRAALSSKKFNFIFAEMGIVARSMMKGKIYRTNKKGVVLQFRSKCHSGESRTPLSSVWMPAFAGMTHIFRFDIFKL